MQHFKILWEVARAFKLMVSITIAICVRVVFNLVLCNQNQGSNSGQSQILGTNNAVNR